MTAPMIVNTAVQCHSIPPRYAYLKRCRLPSRFDVGSEKVYYHVILATPDPLEPRVGRAFIVDIITIIDIPRSDLSA